MQKNHFLLLKKKIKKYRKCPALVLCIYAVWHVHPFIPRSPFPHPLPPPSPVKVIVRAKNGKFGHFLNVWHRNLENLLSSWTFFLSPGLFSVWPFFSKSLFSKIENLAFLKADFGLFQFLLATLMVVPKGSRMARVCNSTRQNCFEKSKFWVFKLC